MPISAVWPPFAPMLHKLRAFVDDLAAELSGGAPCDACPVAFQSVPRAMQAMIRCDIQAAAGPGAALRRVIRNSG